MKCISFSLSLFLPHSLSLSSLSLSLSLCSLTLLSVLTVTMVNCLRCHWINVCGVGYSSLLSKCLIHSQWGQSDIECGNGDHCGSAYQRDGGGLVELLPSTDKGLCVYVCVHVCTFTCIHVVCVFCLNVMYTRITHCMYVCMFVCFPILLLCNADLFPGIICWRSCRYN